MNSTSLQHVTKAIESLISAAKQEGISPHETRNMRLYSTKEVCNMINKTTTSIYRAELLGIIDKPTVDQETGRRVGYSLEQINLLRDHFKVSPALARKKLQRPLGITTAIYNFKGGVAKTTTAVCISQYLAIQGFKVLLIDMDSQASATSLFGFIPDEEIEMEQTVLPFTLHGDRSTLDYAILKTHIDRLDLIPANQFLSSSEFEAASHLAGGGREAAIDYFLRLQDGINTVKNNYDFVFVDAPPSLGIVGIQTMLAVDNIVIPCVPRMLDFVSTKQFLQTATEYVSTIAVEKEFNTIKIMASMLDRRNNKSKQFHEVMQAVLGDYMFKNAVFHSEAIDDASSVFKTPFEIDKPDKRIVSNMKDVFNEITEELIRSNANV